MNKLIAFILTVFLIIVATATPQVKSVLDKCKAAAHVQQSSQQYSLISKANSVPQTVFDCMSALGH